MKVPVPLQGARLRKLLASMREPRGWRRPALPLVVAVLAVSAVVTVTGARSGIDNDAYERLIGNMRLLASDDFVGPAGTAPSSRLWRISTGPGPAPSLQQYSTSPANVSTDGESHLRLTARRAAGVTTSGRVDTSGKLDMSDGVVAARVMFPEGQGIHSSISLMPSDVTSTPSHTGERIQVFGMAGEPEKSTVGIAGTTDTPASTRQSTESVDAPLSIVTSYHTYWIHRQQQLIELGIDGWVVRTFRASDLEPQQKWVFDKPMYLVLDVAVGDAVAGPPAPWVFPATMSIDWVRSYQ